MKVIIREKFSIINKFSAKNNSSISIILDRFQRFLNFDRKYKGHKQNLSLKIIFTIWNSLIMAEITLQ